MNALDLNAPELGVKIQTSGRGARLWVQIMAITQCQNCLYSSGEKAKDVTCVYKEFPFTKIAVGEGPCSVVGRGS